MWYSARSRARGVGGVGVGVGGVRTGDTTLRIMMSRQIVTRRRFAAGGKWKCVARKGVGGQQCA